MLGARLSDSHSYFMHVPNSIDVQKNNFTKEGGQLKHFAHPTILQFCEIIYLNNYTLLNYN